MTAIILVICMTLGLFGFDSSVFAANPMAVEINVESATTNTVTLNWNTVVGTASVNITSGNPNINITLKNLDTAEISGLQNDIMYDIYVEMKDSSGNVIGKGLLYYIPSITFTAKMGDQQPVTLEGGGKEIGNTPKLDLTWNMPRFWDGTGYQYVKDVLSYMETELNNVYGDGRSVSSLNFRINISNNQQTLNGDSDIPSVLINYDKDTLGYKANVINNNTPAEVKYNAGQFSFSLIGRKDTNSSVPPAEQYQLQHESILPGTVYYMNIKPIVKSKDGEMVNALRVGSPSMQNGSPLYGTVPYVYTPIRFRLTRDELGNVYVRIYKLNQGSLSLPRLYYEVQVSDDPTISGDWSVKKTMDDSYFTQGQEYAVSAITGISFNNELYYKIVVKSDSKVDRIESLKMSYIMSADASRPGIPKDLKIEGKKLDTREVKDQDGTVIGIQKTTDVTISWEKPANWDEIKNNTDPKKKLYYQILLNTNQTDLDPNVKIPLEAEGVYYGEFAPVYRLVKFFDATSPNVKENGDRLEYTIKGFDLFMGEDSDGISDDKIENKDNYPDWLLPNKVYYIQMYTTVGEDNKGSTDTEKMSDKSITVSFTTLTDTEMEVPLPKNLRVGSNYAESTGNPDDPIINHIEILFDKVNINWNNYTTANIENCHQYYDIYMSTRIDVDSFIKIGSTQDTDGDVKFTGLDEKSSSIKVSISTFSKQDLVNRFGYKLRPNTVYYFMVKTRLSIDGQPVDLESLNSTMLSVATVKGVTEPPDENSRSPLAPVDFAIANDQDGNPAVTGSSVLLTWKRMENDVKYEIICTSTFISLDETASEFPNDSLYQSFIQTFGGPIIIDPSQTPLQDGLTYDSTTKMCTYLINKWLSPNRVYYFSIRAVNKNTGNTSQWICIPVTTSLINAPTGLEVIYDYQVAFSWTDTTIGLTADDFVLFFKGPDDENYKLLEKNRYIITKYGSKYYARVMNLEANSIYSVRVYKGNISQEPENRKGLVFEKTDLKTRDGCHEIEIKWKGLEGYSYEIAMKEDTSVQYYTLASSNMQNYVDDSNAVLPYRIEKTLNSDGTVTCTFYAKIISGPISMLDGSVQNGPLKSNTKYNIKVRAVKTDPLDATIVSYSKYIGPVDTRTEFSQDDFNEHEEDEHKKVVFLDKINKLEKGLYWEVASSDGSLNSILLKSEQIIDAIRNTRGNSFVLDISSVKSGVTGDAVYVSSNVINELNNQGKSMVIRTSGAEFMIRPGSVDTENDDNIKELYNYAETNDIFYQFKLTYENRTLRNIPTGTKIVSKTNTLDLKGIASTITDKQLKDEIYRILYEENTGLVSKSINILLNVYGDVFNANGDEISIMDQLIMEVKGQLAEYLGSAINIENGPTNYMFTYSQITNFKQPLMATLTYTPDSGQAAPYKLDRLKNKWDKVGSYISYSANTLSFNVSETGEYVILSEQPSFVDINDDLDLKNDVEKLAKRYDIKSVFGTGNNLYPMSSVSVKECILLYEMIAGKDTEDVGMDIKQKAKKLGLEGIVGTGNTLRDITRQEASGLLVSLYALKTGANIDNFKPKGIINITDESDISNKYLKYVQISLDIGLMSTDANGSFNPAASMTRADIINALARIVEITEIR